MCNGTSYPSKSDNFFHKEFSANPQATFTEKP